MIKLYYSPETDITEKYRIIPPPNISITQNMNYSNDVITGYTYTINLNGYAANYISEIIQTVESGELAAETGQTLISENDIIIISEDTIITTIINDNNFEDINKSMPKVLYSIDLIKKILSAHGRTLTIRDEQNNNLLVAKGGTLRSLSFTNTPNNWSAYASYSASLEFNELLFFNESITCENGYINTSSITSNLISPNENKISAFTDSWSFDIDDTALNYALLSDNSSVLDVYNTTINISYNLSATGKNYYIEEKFVPGWVQAKNFVQNRLYNQVKHIDKILALNGGSCNSSRTLSTIHALDSSNLIQSISTNYKLYNEIITCDTSESDGTFGVNYRAILKIDEDNAFSDPGVIHNFTKEYSVNKEGSKTNVTININGTVEGLCDGGIVYSDGNFSLPQNGTLLFATNNNTKFANANNFLTKILNGNDLTETFKAALDINAQVLAASGICESGILPANFTLTNNYMEGIITYDVEYTTDKTCSTDDSESITNISIDVTNPAPIYGEFIVPNGNYIIQDVGTFASKTISMSIEGKRDQDCEGPSDINQLILDYLGSGIAGLVPYIDLPNEDTNIITEKSISVDPIGGSYSINLNYICSSGCNI